MRFATRTSSHPGHRIRYEMTWPWKQKRRPSLMTLKTKGCFSNIKTIGKRNNQILYVIPEKPHTRTQTRHYKRAKSPQNYHTFALFDSSKMGHLPFLLMVQWKMTQVCRKPSFSGGPDFHPSMIRTSSPHGCDAAKLVVSDEIVKWPKCR